MELQSGDTLPGGGGGGASRQNLRASSGGGFPQAATRYIALDDTSANSITTADASDPASATPDRACLFTVPGTLRNMRVRVGVQLTTGQTLVLTLMKNGAASTFACTIDDTGRVFSNLVDTLTVAAEDRVVIRAVTSATTGNVRCSISTEFNPETE